MEFFYNPSRTASLDQLCGEGDIFSPYEPGNITLAPLFLPENQLDYDFFNVNTGSVSC